MCPNCLPQIVSPIICKHVVASRKYLPNPMTFTSAAYSQLRLNQLDPNMFPIQKYSCTADQAISGTFLCIYFFVQAQLTWL